MSDLNNQCHFRGLRTCHVSLPVSAVEQRRRHEALEEHHPRVVAQGDGARGGEGHEHWKNGGRCLKSLSLKQWLIFLTGTEAVAAVVEQLAERAGRVCPPGLLAVDGVQRLVHEQAEAAQEAREPRGLKRMRVCQSFTDTTSHIKTFLAPVPWPLDTAP